MGAFSDFQNKVYPDATKERELPPQSVGEPVTSDPKPYLSFSEFMGQTYQEPNIPEQAIPQAEVP